MKRDIAQGRLPVAFDVAAELAAYAIQCTCLNWYQFTSSIDSDVCVIVKCVIVLTIISDLPFVKFDRLIL